MVYGTFDFDELEVAEAEVKQPASASVSDLTANTSDCRLETAAAVQEAADGSSQHSLSDARAAGELLEVRQPSPETSVRARGKKRMSRARAWFEIRRYFDAEPQQHYGKYDEDEWKTYYAKELILKTTCEKLQQEGFVVIDAQLAPEYFKRLVGQLCLDAPEQVSALENHMDRSISQGALSSASTAEPESPQDLQGAASGNALLPFAHEDCLVESEQDRALCESCLLSLGHDRQGSSELRPRSKQQFMKLFKSVLHQVAANSMDKDRESVPDAAKHSVQFCFGNMPSPKAPLTAPPRPLAIDG